MDEREREAAAAALVSQMDQAQAAFGGVGVALGKMYQALRAAGLPRRLAGAIVHDVGRAWARGTFGSS